MSQENKRLFEDAAKKIGKKAAEDAIQGVAEDAAVKYTAKTVAKGILRLGFFGKALVVIVVVAVAAGAVYYGYRQYSQWRDANRAANNNSVVISEGSQAQKVSSVAPSKSTHGNATPSSKKEGNAAAARSESKLNGTYLDETGTVSLTFAGDTVILNFPTDNYSVKGTYEAVDGVLTFHFDEFTPMAKKPVPYKVNDIELILDGTSYIRQK